MWRLALGLQPYIVPNLSVADRESSRSVCIPGGFSSALSQKKPHCPDTAGRVYITKIRYSNGNASSHSMTTRLKTIPSDNPREQGSTKSPGYHSRTVSQTGREAEGSQQFLAPAPQSRTPKKGSSRSASTNPLPSFSDGMEGNPSTAHIANRPASAMQGLLWIYNFKGLITYSIPDSMLQVPSLTQNPRSSPLHENYQETRTSPNTASPQLTRLRPPSPVPQPVKLNNVQPRQGASDTSRREQNTRVSFYDLPNQATFDRLLFGNASISADGDEEEENIVTTMSNVEEMIEGYEWASDDVITRKSSRGAADMIEARLLDELMALEKAGS